MKKSISLWVRVAKDGRILNTAGEKEWLVTPSGYKYDEVLHDVELKGNFEVTDEEVEL